MERIQAAIQKAKEARGETAAPAGAARPLASPLATGAPRAPQRGAPAAPGPAWAELAPYHPVPARMEAARIVTFDDADPAHVAFDMTRTRLVRTLKANGWSAVGITSPGPGCGKTTLTLNLAFSLAHQADLRTVLVDLDLRRPMVARELDLPPGRSVARFLRGEAGPAETFLRYGENLAIAGDAEPVRHSGDLLMSASAGQAAASVKAAFAPDVILYDLPPMLASADAMAFLPQLDAVLLVAGAEKTRIEEVERCEHELAQNANLLGVVLNMCRYTGEEYGYY